MKARVFVSLARVAASDADDGRSVIEVQLCLPGGMYLMFTSDRTFAPEEASTLAREIREQA